MFVAHYSKRNEPKIIGEEDASVEGVVRILDNPEQESRKNWMRETTATHQNTTALSFLRKGESLM